MSKNPSRRCVTLIELLIAMALVSILMTALMSYYGQVSALHRQADALRDETFQWRYLQDRLSYILPRATAPPYRATKKEKKNDFYFYLSDFESSDIKPHSLVFTYDNGFVADPRFSGTVLARLYLSGQTLRLAIWPLPRCSSPPNPPMLQEVLLENVESVKFEFYNPPDVTGASKPAREVFPKPTETPPFEWTSFWPMTYSQLPALVKITVKRQEDPQTKSFVFMLPNCTKPIVVR